MKKLLVLSLLIAVALAAQATEYKHPPPSVAPTVASSSSQADAASTSKAYSDSSSTSNAQGGAGASIDYYNAGARSYALFSGGAAPLPATTCPKGDSSYLQIAWGLLTVASSTTRTEMECLDKALAALRAQPLPPPMVLPPGPIHPPTKPAAPVVKRLPLSAAKKADCGCNKP